MADDTSRWDGLGGLQQCSTITGGQLVAGTEGGKVIGWQLQPAAFEDAPGSPISERITIESSETSASRSQPPTTTDSAVNGFTKKPLQQKPVQKPLRSSSEAATVNSQAGRYGRGGRILIRVSQIMIPWLSAVHRVSTSCKQLAGYLID